MSEQMIVSLTTYSKRIANLPTVLDTIFSQTHQPDKVVVNLAFDEVIPSDIQSYFDAHSIEVFRVPDTKVYKKLIPTLKRYPNDCVITIDDDFLYPSGMIEDFMAIHRQYPDNPISGNREVFRGYKCHCGCASLMKYDYLGANIDCIDDDVISHCPCDDIVYTFFANRNKHPYVRTRELYFENMKSYNQVDAYSSSIDYKGLSATYSYLVNRFGPVDYNIAQYVKDDYMADILTDINTSFMKTGRLQGHEDIYNSITYKVGNCILKPVKSVAGLFSSLISRKK